MTCRVLGCQRGRARDAEVCADHLNDLWANRLEREVDGFYVLATPVAEPRWRTWTREHNAGKDTTWAA